MKKMLSLLLVLSMLFSMVPMAVFAAEEPTISVGSTTVEVGATAVVVEVSISGNTGFTNFDLQVNYDENLTLTKIGQGSLLQEYNAEYEDLTWSQNTTTGKFSCVASNGIANDGVIAKLTFTAGENAGDNSVSISKNDTAAAAMKNGETVVTPTFNVGSVTVNAKAPSDPYTAEIEASTSTIVNGDNVFVNVNVGGIEDTFNSAMIKVNYDPGYMTFVSGVCNQTLSSEDVAATFTPDAVNGTVTIVDYGDALIAGDNVYTLTFKAADGGNTTVSMDANFSTAEHAEEDDLIEAKNVEDLAVAINHKVTVNNSLEGSVKPTGTDSYTVTIPEYDPNYDYTVTATVGSTTVTPVDNKNGTYTVNNVTDDLVITYVKGNAKSYEVKWTGDTEDVDSEYTSITSATYGQSFTIAIPDKVEPTQVEEGANYTATVSVGSTVIQNLSNGESYTIEGTAITDVITINVVKTPIPSLGSDDITITVSGDAGVAIEGVTGNSITVDPDTDITLVLTPETGYTYSVVVGSGEPVTFIDNEYTFKATESVTITVTKTLNTNYVDVTEYLTLDADSSAGSIWLITIAPDEAGTQLTDKGYTCNGNKMFWSEEYKAYCWLEIAATEENVDTTFDITSGAATAVDYGKDVNKSDNMDVNDAQLVWNMYTVKYTDFIDMSVEKFLRADVNTDKVVSTLDAQTIIEAVMEASVI